MSGLPDEMVPEGEKVVSDQTRCTGCGEEIQRGLFDDDGDFYCTYCHLEQDDDTVHVDDASALCECGYETDMKTTGVFSDGLCWVCPRCLEMFGSRECDDCGREAATSAVWGKAGRYCAPCIDGGEE